MNKEKWDVLTNEELCILYQVDKNDELFEYFLEKNKNLMYKFIHKYLNKHPEYRDDIESLASVGMWEAMIEYKPEMETKFSTFYHYYVLKALCNFYRRLNMIRIPAYKLTDPETLEKNLCMSLNINVSCDGDDVEVLELQADENAISGDDYISDDPEHLQLQKALSTLDGRTQQCLKYYLGLADGRKYTLEEIGNIYGVTRERIRQIMVKGLKKLRKVVHLYLDTAGYELDETKPIHFGICDAKGDKFVRQKNNF